MKTKTKYEKIVDLLAGNEKTFQARYKKSGFTHAEVIEVIDRRLCELDRGLAKLNA